MSSGSCPETTSSLQCTFPRVLPPLRSWLSRVLGLVPTTAGRVARVVGRIADGEGRLQPLVHPDAEEVIGGGIRTPLHPEVGEVEAEAGTEVGTEVGTLTDVYPRLEEVNLLLREAGGVAVRDPVRGRPGGGDMIRQLDSLNFVVPAPMFVAFRSQNVYVTLLLPSRYDQVNWDNTPYLELILGFSLASGTMGSAYEPPAFSFSASGDTTDMRV
ncbi:hypothetical protein AB1N83_011205 [Pleurotus pulmonarius]